MTRAEPPLAVPPMNALPSAHQLVEHAIPRPIDRPDCPVRPRFVVSDEAAVTNACDRPQRRSLEYVPTVLTGLPSSERAF
jgi:hypothetical protein